MRGLVCVGLGLVIASIASIAACGGGDDAGGGAPAAPSGNPGNGDPTAGATATTPTPPAPTPGCGMAGVTGGYLGQQTIAVGGDNRTYALYLPDGYDGKTPYPLILAFHGDGGTGAGLRKSFGIEAASNHAAIVAYPDGASGDEAWFIDDATKLAADIAFSDAIVSFVQKTYCADSAKTFIFGFSRGAYYVNQYACRTKSVLKGVVSNSGGAPFPNGDAESDDNGNVICPAPPIPALQVHGDNDDTVDISEGKKARDYWIGADKCQKTTSAWDPSPCLAYAGCARPEIWCEIPGMGHQIWTSTAQATWKFFSSL